jgi:hypothetical protein
MTSVDTLADDARPAERPPAGERSLNGPNPFLVVGAALAAGAFLARWIDWRGHGHARR